MTTRQPLMNLTVMKCLTALLIAPIFAPTMALAGEGGGSTGGGSGVVMPNGEVHFVDLMNQQDVIEASSKALGFNDVIAKFYKPNQFVKQAGASDPSFYSCAQSILMNQSDRFPVLSHLSKELTQVSVVQVQFQIVTVKASDAYEQMKLRYPIVSTASNRLPAERQEALATYANNQLWISNRLYLKMSNEDQCGLSVHESMRHLNKARLLEVNLTQDEIEGATRIFLGYSVSPSIQASVASKLSHPVLTKQQYDEIADQKAKQADFLSQQMDSWLASRPQDPALVPAWSQKFSQLGHAAATLRQEAAVAINRSAKQTLNDPKILAALGNLSGETEEQLVVLERLTTPLRGSKYMDIINFKTVKR